MTTEKRTFVNLNDFIALRFVCECGEDISVRLAANSKFLSYPDGYTCPHCHRHWFEGYHDERLKTVSVFLDRLAQLRAAKLPFRLEVEIVSGE
jgi:hypothetical protein